MDINKTVLHWAQYQADLTGEQYVLVKNQLGGIDIKHYESVPLVNNDDVLLLVYPSDSIYCDWHDDYSEDLEAFGVALIIVATALVLIARFMFNDYISFFDKFN